MVGSFIGGFGLSTKPPTMIRLFAELFGHYPDGAAAPSKQVLNEG
jgi:hypothetical protein